MGSKSSMTKEEKARALSLIALGREYLIDVIAAGILKGEELRRADTGGIKELQQIHSARHSLHERIQNAEKELIAEVAKNVQ